MKIVDLPDDILSIVFLYLDPRSFLALCGSSKVLHDNYQKDPLFWRSITSSTFRTPISPLLKTDGARWYSLYRRLKTQTRLYTWGQGLKGNLGHGVGFNRGPMRRGRVGGRAIVQSPRLVYQRTTSTWPTEAHVPDDVGVIADLQCGGWSTVILNSQGKLYATGSINSANFVNVGRHTDRFERLEYLTQSTSAVSQFSAGRTHVLALTDDHEILTWDRINAKGLKVLSRGAKRFEGNPVKVVAGWGESSAYIPEIGIVYWAPIKNDQEDDMLDAREVKEKVIPQTARQVLRDGTTIEVLAHVVLEGKIVWITSDSKIWACNIENYNDEDTEPRTPSVQLPGYNEDGNQLQDLQGSFRNFVAFTSSGKVLAGNTDYVNNCFEMARAARNDNLEDKDMSDPANWGNVEALISLRPRDVPALQNSGVISVGFGDWHYQALHSNGQITSYGKELESCGALGLGEAHHGGLLRGQTTGPQAARADTGLRPIADIRGRQIWFEPEKRDWLHHLQQYAQDTFKQHPDQTYWRDILRDPVKQTVFSEWIEQEGRHWEDGPSTTSSSPNNYHQDQLSTSTNSLALQDTTTTTTVGDATTTTPIEKDSHVHSYFALAIGAAGWHSGALVLVDDEKAEETRQKWIHNPSSSSSIPSSSKPDTNSDQQQQPPPPMPGSLPFHPPDGNGGAENNNDGPKPVWVEEEFPRIRFPDGFESPAPTGLAEGEYTLGSALRSWRDGMPTMRELGLQPF